MPNRISTIYGAQAVVSMNLYPPDFCLLGTLENSQRRCVDGNLDVPFLISPWEGEITECQTPPTTGPRRGQGRRPLIACAYEGRHRSLRNLVCTRRFVVYVLQQYLVCLVLPDLHIQCNRLLAHDCDFVINRSADRTSIFNDHF